MWAGLGDTYAKYYEATISSRGEQAEHFTSLGVALSVMCRNPLLEYGAKALEDHKKGLMYLRCGAGCPCHRRDNRNCLHFPDERFHPGL